ncbi:MAG: rhomboid family intramembrane serine protease [Acidobacteriota bacterium]
MTASASTIRRGFRPMPTPAVLGIIGACIVLYVASTIESLRLFVANLPINPFLLRRGAVWQLVTYSLLSWDARNLLWDMLVIYMFGPMLEETWGRWRFVRFVLLTTITGGIAFWIAAAMAGGTRWHGTMSLALALAVAWAGVLPRVRLNLLFPPVEVTTEVLAIAFCAIDMLFVWDFTRSLPLTFAHLVPAGVGYAYLRYGYRLRLDRLRIPNVRGSYTRWKNRRIARKFRVVVDDRFLSPRDDEPPRFVH